MHTGAEELSTGSRLTTVMKLIRARGDKEIEKRCKSKRWERGRAETAE